MTLARPWYGARILVASAAPLRLTFWVLVVGAAVILALIGFGVALHLRGVRDERRRERVHRELEPVFRRFLQTDDATHLAAELRPAFMRMDAAHRPVAALLTIEVMHEATPAQKEQLREELEQSGIVELGERGTRRLSPWRRALACELLGEIGAERSVPALLARLEDRRPEVRMAAVRALGDVGSKEAVPALSTAFLERRVAPTNVVNNALRRIGGEAAPVFDRGITSDDPIVRVASCFGYSGIAEEHGLAVVRLADVLASDPDPRVRAAAAAALGIVGGDDAPSQLLDATTDLDVHVRRSAVKALASYHDPTAGGALFDRTDDEDRETAIRATEALLALSRRPRAAAEARSRLESGSAWAIEYARKLAEVGA
jgi:HEAT repeat protein